MQTILVATDHSRAASNALAYAAALARHTQAKLVLFNAFQLPAPLAISIGAGDWKNRFITENKARLASLAKQIAHWYGVQVSWTDTQASFAESLDQQVEHSAASLVVIGMRRKASDDLFFGSTTTSLIRHAKYPVLVVPEDYTFTGLNKIIFACDYHLLATDNKLSLLQQIARAFEAEVQVLHVEKEEEELVAAAYQGDLTSSVSTDHLLASVNLDALFTNIRHSYKYVEDREIVQGISRGIAEFKADLLVMVPHKTTFWETLLEKSNTCKMALKTQVPLLALPNLPH